MRESRMKIIDKYYKAKVNYSKSIILIKNGIFYETLNDDAYIMNYLFKYKIKKLSNSIIVRFPQKTIEKIIDELKKENVSYVIFNDNYRLVSNKNIYMANNYDKLLQVSKNCNIRWR
jgi:DNA mismatch repair ATPase MutS